MSQLTKGQQQRLMYIENKQGDIDGFKARIGWVTFSKSGRSIYYRNLTLKRIKGGGISGNYYSDDTVHEYWVSGIKKRGDNAHYAESVDVHVDEVAMDEFLKIKGAL